MSKRTPRRDLEAASARSRIASLYLQGRTQAEIAKQIGCTRQNVGKHLKRIMEDLRRQAAMDFGEAVAVQLAKIDQVEREAWRGWERSQEDGGFVQTKEEGSEGCETTIKSYRRDGNPKFLKEVLNCVSKRCGILGLDSPKTIRLEDAERITDTVADVILSFVPEEDQDAALAMIGRSGRKPPTVH